MRNALVYLSFIITSLLVVAAFVTATSYVQLAIGIILYPLVVYFALKIFPRKSKEASSKKHSTIEHHEVKEEKLETNQKNGIGINDIDKRAFLKLIGATGLSFFLLSIFGRRIEALLFGQSQIQLSPPFGNNSPDVVNQANAASPTDGYNISEIDNNIVSYYGFINKNEDWFIMRGDANKGTFRYARGSGDFPSNWKNRSKLDYDYFYRVFP